MATITGIPTTRVSDSFIRSRLLAQLSYQQQDLFSLEQSISTGKRYGLPSQEPSAALRTISLQSLMEQKTQTKTNLTTNQSFLAASDSAISSVSSVLNDVRGAALSVADTVSSSDAKQAVAQQVDEAISQLIKTGNTQFRGRYLFSGSDTAQRPFEQTGSYVSYAGNEKSLHSYSDIDTLFDTNVTGDAVFGAISDPVRGSVDLNPILSNDTPLADLYGGAGVSDGSVALSNGTSTVTVDVSGAKSIGDVARLLQVKFADGGKTTARVTPHGLELQVDQGNLSVREVAGGTTARELGILQETGVGTAPLVGKDLNPALRLTTRLDDVLGARASALVNSNDDDSSLLLEANNVGDVFNGYTIELTPGGTASAETVNYDTAAKKITVSIANGVSTAQGVVDAINASPAAADFTAKLAPGNDGTGVLLAGDFTTSGGDGAPLDRDSGLQIVNGGQTHTVSFSSAKTVEDLLNILNGSDAGVLAQINDTGDGLDLRTRVSGSDFSVGENGGTTAAQLGLRSFTESTRLDDLNFGVGIHTRDGADFAIRRKDGVTLNIDLNAGLSAAAKLNSAGADNALIVRANQTGADGNSYQVQIQDSGPGGGNSVSLVDHTLTFSADLAAGFTAQDAVDLLANSSLSGQFTAVLDHATEPGNTGAGNLAATAPVSLEGGRASADTIGDVLAYINENPDNQASDTPLVARLAKVGNGIELVDDNLAGAEPLTVLGVESDGQTAEDLGLLGFQQLASDPPTPGVFASAAVDGGDPNSGLIIQTKTLGEGGNAYKLSIVDNAGGSPNSVALNGDTLTFSADLTAGFTAQDAIDLLAADPTLSDKFSAELDLSANPNNTGAGDLTATAQPIDFSGGKSETLQGADVNAQQSQGVFTALVRLRNALTVGDVAKINQSLDLLDNATVNLNFTHAELGAREQSLDALSSRLDSEQIDLQAAFSQETDIDLSKAIVDTQRPAGLAPSLVSNTRANIKNNAARLSLNSAAFRLRYKHAAQASGF